MEKIPEEQKPTTMAQAKDKEQPTSPSAGAPEELADASRSRLLPLAWPLFTAVWLLFPVGFVVQVLGTGLTPVEMLAFLAAMAAFVAVFLWLMLRYPFPAAALSRRQLWVRGGLLTVLAALALYVELAYASGIPYRFMFVVLAAAVTLPTLHAAWVVLATTVAVSGTYALQSGGDASVLTWTSAVVPFLAVGIGMILVSRLVVTVRELQAAKEEIARLAVAEERLRFARDLHDLLGHSLSQITLKSELAGRLLPESPETEGAARELQDIEDVARKALGEVREAVSGYRQPTLEGELQGAREMLEAAGISWWIENKAGGVPPNGTDAVLGWAVREGVTNVIRHSQAVRCQIRVRQDGGQIHAEITDDGLGSESEHDGASTGSGLSGLAERVSRSGGDIEAGPMGEGGFRLRVSLPLRNGATETVEQASKTDDARGDGRR